MEFLTSRDTTKNAAPGSKSKTASKEWSNTRNYVYNREELTVEDVKMTLDFLDQGTKTGNMQFEWNWQYSTLLYLSLKPA